MKRTLLAALAAILALASTPAFAGTAHLEWLNTTAQGGPPADPVLDPSAVTGFAEEITTGGVAVQSGAAPAFRNGTGYARVTARDGAVIVAPSGTASATNGWLIAQGQSRSIPVPAGGHLSFLADPAAAAIAPVSCATCATAAGQATEHADLAAIDGHVDGLEAGVASIAANTSGVATASNQATANASLANLETNTTGLATASGQATEHADLVAIDGHVDGLEASAASIAANTSGVATAANQATANSSLSTIAANTTGAATAANQTAALADAGSDAAKAVAVQGVTGGKAVGVNPDSVPDAATRSATVSSATVGDSFSTAGYGSVTFQVVGNASANTWIIEGSNDGGTTWNTLLGRRTGDASNTANSATYGASGTAVSAGAYVPQTVMPMMRWRVGTYNGGTTTIAVGLKRAAAATLLDVNVGNTTIAVNAKPTTTGGLTVFRIATGASGAGKSGASQLYAYDALNTTASVRYLQFYNKATAGVPGSDTPVFTAPLAANGRTALAPSAGLTIGATGCSWAITTDAAGATVATSGDVVGSFATN